MSDEARLTADYARSLEATIDAREDAIERLRALLREAADDIEDWGSYASEFFQKKHDLAGNVQKYRDALSAAPLTVAPPREPTEQREQPKQAPFDSAALVAGTDTGKCCPVGATARTFYVIERSEHVSRRDHWIRDPERYPMLREARERVEELVMQLDWLPDALRIVRVDSYEQVVQRHAAAPQGEATPPVFHYGAGES